MSRGNPLTVLGLTGLSVAQHDNSAVIVRDGRVLFASSEERFSRRKHDPSFPRRTIAAGLRFCGLSWRDIDVVAVGFPPYDLRALLRQYPGQLLRLGVAMAVRSPLQVLCAASSIPRTALRESAVQAVAAERQVRGKRVVMVDHHLAHAASAFSTSGLDRAIAVVLDGYGATADGRLLSGAVYLCEDGRVRLLEEIPVGRSLGIFYTAITNILGFTPKDGEGKVMGLAAYGRRTKLVEELRSVILEPRRGDRISASGSAVWSLSPYWLDGLLAGRKEWRSIFEATPLGARLVRLRKEAGGRPQDLAYAMQAVLEEEGVRYMRSVHRRFGKRHRINDYVFAGGIFLNVRLNKKIRKLPFVRSVFVHPNPGDGGVALGAALSAPSVILASGARPGSFQVRFRSFQWASSLRESSRNDKAIRNDYHLGGGIPWTPRESQERLRLRSAALGMGYTQQEMREALRKYGQSLSAKRGKITWTRPKNIASYTADALVAGKVVGWFQGRAEWGPRALGQRSVLADPRDVKTRDRINRVLKNRDWFMPFAPAILEEKAAEYFVDGQPSPFMTQTYALKPKKATKIPAAIHIDGTCRPQTVRRQENPRYYDVIRAFYRRTGIPAILNTSFNRHGLPIVNTPKDAIEHLLWGCVDELILGPWVVVRQGGQQ